MEYTDDEFHKIPADLLEISEDFPNVLEITSTVGDYPGPRLVRQSESPSVSTSGHSTSAEVRWSYYGYRDITHTGATLESQRTVYDLPECFDFKGFAYVWVHLDERELPGDYDISDALDMDTYEPLPQPWLQDWRDGKGTFATESIGLLLLEDEVDMGMLVDTVEYLKLHRASALPKDLRVHVSGRVTDDLLWRLMHVASVYCESLEVSLHQGRTQLEPTIHRMLGLRAAPLWRRLGRKCRKYTLPVKDYVLWSAEEAGWDRVPEEVEAAYSLNGIGRGGPVLGLESLTLEYHTNEPMEITFPPRNLGQLRSKDITLAPPAMDEAAIIMLDILGRQCKVRLKPAALPPTEQLMIAVAGACSALELDFVTQYHAIYCRRRFLKKRRHAAEHPAVEPPSWRKLELHERLPSC